MQCSKCNDEIGSRSIRQGDEYFCSLECANMALGIETDDFEAYYDEHDLEGLHDEYDE